MVVAFCPAMVEERLDGLGDEGTGGLPPEALLLRAIQSGNVTDTRTALAAGVDLSHRLTSKSFLRLAGEAGHRRICELLVEYGADPNEVSGKRRYALLHNAVATGNYGFASTLLKLGANPDAQNSSGATPLHFAARSGQGYIARELVKRGASLGAKDRQGRTPYDLAVEHGHDHMANQLRSLGQSSTKADRSWTR